MANNATCFAASSVIPLHLELYDVAGRRLDHRLGSQMRSTDGDRYQLIASPPSENGPGACRGTSKPPIPSELRYYQFFETALEIPFDFRDIAMP